MAEALETRKSAIVKKGPGEFFLNPENVRCCKECPAKLPDSGWVKGSLLPCGQPHCWVEIASGKWRESDTF